MKIYNYHPETGEYLGESLADADPLDIGNWLIPANASEVPPPLVQQKEVAVFKNDNWVIESDHRGEVWYDVDGTKIEIEEIGLIPNENWTSETPQIPEKTEQIIARLEGAIDIYLDAQANTYRYESIRTMVTYENDPNPKFNAEGVGAKAFRSAVYTLGVSLIGEVQSGLREVPTEEELIAEMPLLSDFIVYPA